MSTLREILLSQDPATILHDMDRKGTLRNLEPTLAELRMPIPKGVHHKDNLDHSIVVLRQAVEREVRNENFTEPDLILRTAALFHDIGKPATRKFAGRKTVTFDGHEVVGARMVRKILPKHGYSKTEISMIAELVELHMRAHGFENGWTDSAVRRVMADTSNHLQLERLIIVFHADLTTSNARLSRAVTRSIDSLTDSMIRIRAMDARNALRPALNGNDLKDIFGLDEGRVIGKVMRFLNTDEGIALSREEAINKAREIISSE